VGQGVPGVEFDTATYGRLGWQYLACVANLRQVLPDTPHGFQLGMLRPHAGIANGLPGLLELFDDHASP
jgi:hypothetical protein